MATGSADAVIKIWNLGDYACVKQLEGQECSVLSLAWISGHQIVSSGSDGLIKVDVLFYIYTFYCNSYFIFRNCAAYLKH